MLLERFSGLKEITNIRSRGKKRQMSAMRQANGTEVHEKQDIADVFASFYEQLFGPKGDEEVKEDQPSEDEREETPPPVTAEEVQEQLKKMAKKKAADAAGIVVEMLQCGGQALAELLAEVFSAILQAKARPPEYWKMAMVKVLYKAGDAKDPANYRPICLLPILYKVFSKIQCKRIGVFLDAEQPVDQAGFRATFSCEDHLLTVVQLAEKAEEFQLPLWMAAIDFKKAFDCVDHGSLWQALREQGVPKGYVRVCRDLYTGQKGMVNAGAMSRTFDIVRGTKQGDPMSPKLFNAVLQKAMKPLVQKWLEEGHGYKIAGKSRLTNLRFADDVILAASSAASLGRFGGGSRKSRPAAALWKDKGAMQQSCKRKRWPPAFEGAGSKRASAP